MDEYDYLFKFLLIGDSNVGKTCVLYRLCDLTFSVTFISTIGIDFKIKTFEIDNKKIKLQIWDTAGQERFRTITTAYYRGAIGIIIVFDLTNLKSFQNLSKWIELVRENGNADANIIILGNKCDIEENKAVTENLVQDFLNQYNFKYFEVSAKSGKNVHNAFYTLAKIVKEKNDLKIEETFDIECISNKANIKVSQKTKKFKKCC